MTMAHRKPDSGGPGVARRFAGWTSHRPVLNGLIGAVAMAGLAVVFYLGQQQAKGFEDGCSVGPLDAAPTFDCAAAAGSPASTLLGVSNIVWGSLFYIGIALLSAGMAARPRWYRSLHRVRAVGIGVGVLYSGYLTFYQFAYLDALCALCLTSAGLVAGLAVLQTASLYAPSDSA
jgi:uncharacterized membrane protein